MEKLLASIRKRYGDQWDLKLFTEKANQKCRDSRTVEMPDPDPKASMTTSGSTSESTSESSASSDPKNSKTKKAKNEKDPKDLEE